MSNEGWDDNAKGGCGCLMMLVIPSLVVAIWQPPMVPFLAFIGVTVIFLFIFSLIVGIFTGE